MFRPPGRRSGSPREPGSRWDGPWPGPPPGHKPAWDEPPWEQQHRRHRPRWRPPSPRAPRAFPGPGDIPWKEEEEQDRRWAPQDCPPRPPWDDREDFQGHEDGFGEGWHLPSPRDPRAFPGPGDIPWQEEQDRRWAPQDCPPRPPWDDREDFQGHEDGFREDWHPELPPGPWPKFPEEEQPPPWLWNPGAFGGHQQPWGHRPAGRRRSHLRELTPGPLAWCPRPPRGHKPHPKPSPAPSKKSQREARKELQPPEPPQPPAPLQGAAERPDQPQELPVGRGNVLEPPGAAGSPGKSPAAATEPPVELEAGHTPVGSQDQDPCALGTDPAPPEETSGYAEIQERPEVKPRCPGVPKAGTKDGSHPQSPAAPPDPARRELLGSSSSGEAGAELSPHSWEQPLPGARGAEAEAAQDGPLQSLQPPEIPQLPPGSAAGGQAQPSQASPGACSPPETPPGRQRPPGSAETNPAASGQHQLCSVLPTPSPAGADRSATVLAKKAEIELSYQQFSLTIAVVATMLLQKEPSMEAALGVALRANLRQGGIQHLQQLEEFINSLDSASASL